MHSRETLFAYALCLTLSCSGIDDGSVGAGGSPDLEPSPPPASGGAETGISSGGSDPGTSNGGTAGSLDPDTGGSATGGAPSSGGADMGSGGSATTPTPTVVGSPIGFASENGGTTGGLGGETVTVTNYSDLVRYAESGSPYVILVEGTISNGAGGGRIRVAANKSIVGVGREAFLSGVGLSIQNSNNVIVQNLRMTLVGTSTPSSVNGGDVVSISGTSKNVWIDHCELFSEDPSIQTNIDKYDGLLDIRDQTGFITISWSYLHDHHKGGLVGASDSDLHADRKITFHHNRYENVRLRVPMFRGAVGHFFNNLVIGARDATELRAGTCVRVERNYYGPLRYSIYTPTDARGNAERIGNVEVERTSRAYPANCSADIPYSYSSVLTASANDVPTLVTAGAGVGKL